MTGAQWLGMYESDEAGKEAAAAYVAGYVDGVQSAEATSRKKRFCVPETVTEVELADEVAKYLAGKSVFRQMGAPFVIEGDEYDSAFFDKRPKFVHYRPAAAILTAHGGELELENGPDGGAVVTLALPAARRAEPDTALR